MLPRVTDLSVMQKLEELESNARSLTATGWQGAAIYPHCATMGLQGNSNTIGNNWLVESRNWLVKSRNIPMLCHNGVARQS